MKELKFSKIQPDASANPAEVGVYEVFATNPNLDDGPVLIGEVARLAPSAVRRLRVPGERPGLWVAYTEPEGKVLRHLPANVRQMLGKAKTFPTRNDAAVALLDIACKRASNVRREQRAASRAEAACIIDGMARVAGVFTPPSEPAQPEEPLPQPKGEAVEVVEPDSYERRKALDDKARGAYLDLLRQEHDVLERPWHYTFKLTGDTGGLKQEPGNSPTCPNCGNRNAILDVTCGPECYCRDCGRVYIREGAMFHFTTARRWLRNNLFGGKDEFYTVPKGELAGLPTTELPPCEACSCNPCQC